MKLTNKQLGIVVEEILQQVNVEIETTNKEAFEKVKLDPEIAGAKYKYDIIEGQIEDLTKQLRELEKSTGYFDSIPNRRGHVHNRLILYNFEDYVKAQAAEQGLYKTPITEKQVEKEVIFADCPNLTELVEAVVNKLK